MKNYIELDPKVGESQEKGQIKRIKRCLTIPINIPPKYIYYKSNWYRLVVGITYELVEIDWKRFIFDMKKKAKENAKEKARNTAV